MSNNEDFQNVTEYLSKKKKVGVAYLLWFFLGIFGAHRFYIKEDDPLGYTELGLIFGGGGLACITPIVFFIPLAGAVMVLIDIFLIPALIKTENIKLIKKLDINIKDYGNFL